MAGVRSVKLRLSVLTIVDAVGRWWADMTRKAPSLRAVRVGISNSPRRIATNPARTASIASDMGMAERISSGPMVITSMVFS
ncbi:hypothetical protein GCM10029978_090910 [Actinoallomurus acanthiterrae]